MAERTPDEIFVDVCKIFDAISEIFENLYTSVKVPIYFIWSVSLCVQKEHIRLDEVDMVSNSSQATLFEIV